MPERGLRTVIDEILKLPAISLSLLLNLKALQVVVNKTSEKEQEKLRDWMCCAGSLLLRPQDEF
jgi:hypothetical protein